MAVCASCGFENAAGLKFCGECGARLVAPVATGGRERKTVSVLFCDLVGFTAASDGADPEEVQARLSPYHTRARVEIERFGGTVEKFIGDAVMAAFGAPLVHEDDPERAVRAGLALLAAVAELNAEQGLGLSVRVGVATGEAVVSTGARPERGEGMLAGDVVNTAARLQTAAPVGAVLVGQATRDATRASIEYQPMEPVNVKGKADPLPVWVAMRARGSAGEALTDTSRPMIGRADELSALQRAYTRAVRENSVQLVTVVAEPGLGKSRLVQAFSDWVDARDELVTWRQGRCPSYGDAVTHAALAQIVKAQTAILDTDGPSTATAKLSDTVHALVVGTDLATQESWLVARLAPLVGLTAPESPKEELFTAWRRFFEALAATSPLVLVIEDLHWADPAMLEFLTHLLDWMVGVPLVIIATTRPELFTSTPDWGAGHRNSSTLTLVPLSDIETAQLVNSLLGTAVLPADLHAALLTRAGGNPLYTREYLNMVTERSGVISEPDPAGVEDLLNLLPGSVQAVIAARLDTLPASSKQLLQAAAVVGHTFWAGAVAALTGSDPNEVKSRLHELVRGDYLRPSRSSSIGGESEYTFNHALIADVAYHQLPRAARAARHQHAGDWHAAPTSSGEAGATGGQAAVIAHHYTEAHTLTQAAAGDPSQVAELGILASRWHGRAARQAQSLDLVTAESHTRTALRLTPTGHPDRPRLLMLLGEIVLGAGRATDAEGVYQQAREEARACNDPVVGALADVNRVSVLETLAQFEAGTDILERAVTVLERHPPGPELLEAYVVYAHRLMTQGRYDQVVSRAEQALELAGRLEDAQTRWVAAALGLRGSARVWSGDPSGESDLLQGLELAQTHDLTGGLLQANGEIGYLKWMAVSAAAAVPYLEQAVVISAERGRRRDYLLGSANLAEALAVTGRMISAIDVCERAADTLADIDSPREASLLQTCWAWVLSIRGDLDRAEALIAAALPVARGAEPTALIDLLLVAIDCAHIRDDDETAQALTAELLGGLQDPDADAAFTQYLTRLARALIPAGRGDVIRRIIGHSPAGMLFYDNNVLTARALLAESHGEHEAALDLHAAATAGWTSYGYPLEQAHALLGMARCRYVLHQPADEPLDEARGILVELGAAPLLTQTDTRRRSIPS